MKHKICTVYSFLNAAKGNWRNSVFIECKNYLCDKHALSCPGFLLNFDRDLRPVIISADIIRKMTGMPVDKEECILTISREYFETLCALWTEWEVDSPRKCALSRIVNQTRCCNNEGGGPCCF